MMKCRVLEVARTALMPPQQRVHAHFCDWFSLYHATLVDGSLLFCFSVNLRSMECFYCFSPKRFMLFFLVLFFVFFFGTKTNQIQMAMELLVIKVMNQF